MLVGVLVRVVMLPPLELVAPDLTCTAALFVQLKQYKVPTASSPDGNVTVWEVTFEAVPTPTHAVPPAGHARLVVLTVKLAALPSVYPVGKTTWTDASVATVAGSAQTVPVVCVETLRLSKRTMLCDSCAALAVLPNRAKPTAENARTAENE